MRDRNKNKNDKIAGYHSAISAASAAVSRNDLRSRFRSSRSRAAASDQPQPPPRSALG